MRFAKQVVDLGGGRPFDRSLGPTTEIVLFGPLKSPSCHLLGAREAPRRGFSLDEVHRVSKPGDNRAEPSPKAIDWRRTYEQLVAYGRRRHRLLLEDAQQVAQEAIRRFFDPTYLGYDSELHGSVLRFLGSIVNGIVSNERQRGSSAKSFLGFANEQEMPSPEEDAIARERFNQVVAKLMERTTRDHIARKLLAVMLEGVEGIEREAEKVGVSAAEEIEKARRRLKAHVEAITNSLGEN
jgi:hypothetical protein